MADVQGLQAEEFGMLLSQLEQQLSDYRRQYASPDVQSQIGVARQMETGFGPDILPRPGLTGPPSRQMMVSGGIDQVMSPVTMPPDATPSSMMPSWGQLGMGLVVGGLGGALAARKLMARNPLAQSAESSPPVNPLSEPRSALRATAATVADLPYVVKDAAGKVSQSASDVAGTVVNPLARATREVRAGVDDARLARLQREGEAVAAEYERLNGLTRPMTPDEVAQRAAAKDRIVSIGDDIRKLTGENQLVDTRGFGMYDIPDLKMRRPSPLGVPMPPDSELPVYLRRTPLNPLIADQRPGRVQSGASPLPEMETPLTIQGVPFSRVGESEGYRRPAVRTDALTYEDNPAAQARVRRGQEYLAEPRGRTQQPMPDFDGTNARDRLQWLVQKGKISKESVLSSPDPAKMLEITAEYLGYRGPQRMQALATDLGIVGGPGADLRIGGIVKSGPQGFESRPEWQAYDRTMGDAQSMGRFSANPPSPVRSGPDLVETPHGMRDPVTGRWVSGPRQTPQGDARAQSGGFGDAPDNPLARRPRR